MQTPLFSMDNESAKQFYKAVERAGLGSTIPQRKYQLPIQTKIQREDNFFTPSDYPQVLSPSTRFRDRCNFIQQPEDAGRTEYVKLSARGEEEEKQALNEDSLIRCKYFRADEIESLKMNHLQNLARFDRQVTIRAN